MRRLLAIVGTLVGLLFPQISAAGQGAPTAEQGAKVYAAQKCSAIRLPAWAITSSPLDGVGSKLTDDQIREWIVNPKEAATKAKSTAKPPMRAYPNLPKADVDALVEYMKSLNKK